MHIFYYGIWIAGVVGLASLILTAITNRKTQKDITKMPNPKGRWLQAFCRELDRQGTEIRNPMVFVTRRMNGRKIGHISFYRMKGIMWYAFVFCFLCMGIAYYQTSIPGMRSMGDLLSQTKLVTAGLGVPLGLILFRQILGVGYQERCIRDALLDYMENGRNIYIKDKLQMAATQETLPASLPIQAKPARMPKRERAARNAAQDKEKEAIKDKILEQLSLGLQESAASKEKYKHLLSKEEEQIIRDVINEFLA